MTEPARGSPEFFSSKTPDAAAVVEGARSLSWAEWDELANRLAEALAQAGLGAGDRVVVRTQICPEWFVVNQALARLGAVHVAASWRLTPSEARYIAEDSGACALLFDDADPEPLARAWDDLALRLRVTIGSPGTRGAERYEELVARPGAPRRIAARPAGLVIYTSGTTGRPKGVAPDPALLASRGKELVEYLMSVGASLPGGGPRTLLTLPLHHGAGLSSARACHVVGGTLHLLRRFEPEAAMRIVSEERITHWVSVPTMLLRMAALPEEVRRRYDLSSLEGLVLGAAPVSYALKEWIVANIGERCLYEGYGSTETGMITSMPPELQRTRPGSCGRPYRHVQIRILDDAGREHPVGETGEIAVRTPAVIERYLNRPKLEADTLDADGFFHTGDVGRLDSDGFLYITDRKKDMIIAGGVNLYPAEIEAALVQHPEIVDAAVIGIPDDDLGERVHAFCERVPGSTLTQAQLIEFSARELAPYKRPRSVEFVAELPRNPTGKVLKTTLREPYWQGRERRI